MYSMCATPAIATTELYCYLEKQVNAIAPEPCYFQATSILPFATSIEAVRIFNNAIQLTYWTGWGRCSTFMSIRAFVARACEQPFQVGDIVKINSGYHGDFFCGLPALVTAATSSIGVVVEVMGQKRWFGNEELMMVRPSKLMALVPGHPTIDDLDLPKGCFLRRTEDYLSREK